MHGVPARNVFACLQWASVCKDFARWGFERKSFLDYFKRMSVKAGFHSGDNFPQDGNGQESFLCVVSSRSEIMALKAMSHEAICSCNLQCNFCRKKYCRLQLGCQMYATCLRPAMRLYFKPAEYLKMSAAF